MLNLIAMSDLHLGFDRPSKPFGFDLPKECDLVLMAGDIADGCKAVHLDWILNATNETPVIITLGNHELYGTSRNKVIEEYQRVFDNTHVHFLLNESIVFKGIRIAATDLWTDFAINGNPILAMNYAQSMMNDFNRITIKEGGSYRNLRPADTVKWHAKARSFIKATLNQSDEPVVLMTHHGVSQKGISPLYQYSPLNPAFTSDLESLFEAVKQPPVLSIFGHTHSHICEYLNCGTLLYCNARGYAVHEIVKGFNPSRLLSINKSGNVSVITQ